jgi:hypothetical protein
MRTTGIVQSVHRLDYELNDRRIQVWFSAEATDFSSFFFPTRSRRGLEPSQPHAGYFVFFYFILFFFWLWNWLQYVARKHQWISDYISMVLRPFVCPWPICSFSIFYTTGRTPWTGEIIQSQGRYLHTGHHKNWTNAHRQPCLKWDLNPRSQCLSGRRQFMP